MFHVQSQDRLFIYKVNIRSAFSLDCISPVPYHIYPSNYKITAIDGVRLPELILRPKGLPFSLDLYRKYEKEWLSAKEKYAKTTSG